MVCAPWTLRLGGLGSSIRDPAAAWSRVDRDEGGAGSRADCSSSSGGSSSSERRFRSSRNFRVVAKSAGRPGVSRWPTISIQPRSSSAFSVGGETATPRMSSMSPRVTGWRYAMIASVSSTARE